MHDPVRIMKARDFVKRAIETRGFVRTIQPHAATSGRHSTPGSWVFDIKAVLLDPNFIEAFTFLFWDTFGSRGRFQIGAMETAGIPIVAALITTGHRLGHPINGFYIRKSRNKEGLAKMIEGEFLPEIPVILVDDILNTGKHFIRQVEVVESFGGMVASIWSLVRFRDPDFYEYLRRKNIDIHSVLELNDFNTTLGIRNTSKKDRTSPRPRMNPAVWRFSSGSPDYRKVAPKSGPVIDEHLLYFGADNGTMWALDQRDGSVVWRHWTGTKDSRRGIRTTPLLYGGNVYFGSYDGNVYALDAATGKKRWIYFGADWVGSSPDVAPDLGLVFIGLEFGIWRKRGGIVALDSATGRTVWEYQMTNFTHSSPLYVSRHSQVVIGSNDGAAYLFDAKSGNLMWKFQPTQPTETELNSGYSESDIKGSFAYDEAHDRIIFGTMRGDVFSVDRKSGGEIGRFKAEFGIYSNPVIYEGSVLVSSLDKHLYCLDLASFTERWRWNAGARIFATPIVIDNSIFIGSNAGVLAELDAATGREKTFLTLAERITNSPAYNAKTKRLFVPTYANEIFCFDL